MAIDNIRQRVTKVGRVKVITTLYADGYWSVDLMLNETGRQGRSVPVLNGRRGEMTVDDLIKIKTFVCEMVEAHLSTLVTIDPS